MLTVTVTLQPDNSNGTLLEDHNTFLIRCGSVLFKISNQIRGNQNTFRVQ